MRYLEYLAVWFMSAVFLVVRVGPIVNEISLSLLTFEEQEAIAAVDSCYWMLKPACEWKHQNL